MQGVKAQSRLRIFTVPYDRVSIQKEPAFKELLNGLGGKLTDEKYTAIAKYFVYPLDMVSISEDISQDLFKFFDARNAVFSVEYPHDRIKDTGDAMLAELDVRTWIEKVGRNVLKCAPNSIVILDKDENGDILLIDLPNEKLLGYQFTKEGDFKFIVFEHSKGHDELGKPWEKRGVYDEKVYRVYIKTEGSKDFNLESEFPHNLGKCPARFFYNKPLINKHEFNRSIPFSPVRGSMEKWTVFNLFQYYQKHFAAFQVIQYAQNECLDPHCTDGIVSHVAQTGEGGVIIKPASESKCQVCAKNGLVAPGTTFGVKVSDVKDEKDARDVFKFISPQIDSLVYLDEDQDKLESKIKQNTVGFSDAVTSDAINETQVKALVESRKKPLLEIKPYLEALYKWIVEGSVKLVYDVDIVANANYGTEWFILTRDQLLDIIIKAKTAGAQSTYIEQLNKQVIETEYKGNPHLAKRMMITADLEPNAFDSQQEAREKHNEGVMSDEDYYIKSNFVDLIAQFERENLPITLFGVLMPYKEKINKIKEVLLSYTKGKITKKEDNGES